MPICHYCGEEIEFRYMDGRPTPIHIHGGWCQGHRSSVPDRRPFQTIESYVNPDAICPVCGEIVFYYQGPNGGRVFFDALGWPWPKHPCTDNPKAKTARIINPERRPPKGSFFKDGDGHFLNLYILDWHQDFGYYFEMTFKNVTTGHVFTAKFSSDTLRRHDISIQDFLEAPSFVSRRGNEDGKRVIEFISERHRKILRIRVKV